MTSFVEESTTAANGSDVEIGIPDWDILVILISLGDADNKIDEHLIGVQQAI